jgi:SsrA-binding protein
MAETVASNKKAFRDFEIFERWECGIVLTGAEVKSIRAGEVNFKDSFARLEKEEVWLYNLHISPYGQASFGEEEPDRMRKLLLNRREIKKLFGKVSQKGLTLVPTKIYFNKRGFAKVELALAKGRRLYDKREAVKKKTLDRELKRAVRTRR